MSIRPLQWTLTAFAPLRGRTLGIGRNHCVLRKGNELWREAAHSIGVVTMPYQLDPEESEVKHLHDIAPLPGATVLEIGCGNGRLISRYAASARQVVGVEPRPEPLALAMRSLPPTLNTKVTFVQANAEVLPFHSGAFNVAILAWSL